MSFTYFFYAILPIYEIDSLNLKSDDHPDWQRVNDITTTIELGDEGPLIAKKQKLEEGFRKMNVI